MHEQLHGTRRVTTAPAASEQAVADVHLTGEKPVALHVVVEPPDDLSSDEDACDGPRIHVASAEPPAGFVVVSGNERRSVAGFWWTNGDYAVCDRTQDR